MAGGGYEVDTVRSTRIFGRKPGPKWFTDLHRFLGGIAVVFTAIHVGALVADNYVYFGLREVLLPMASSWKPVPVAIRTTLQPSWC